MSIMSSKERMLAAINCQKADHLPVTTHHVMPSFLDKYMSGMSYDEFFEHFGLDAIQWAIPHRPDESNGEFYNPDQGEIDFLGNRLISSDTWQIKWEEIPGQDYHTIRYNMVTPGGTLTTVTQSNEHTSWVTEHLIKNKSDIELIGEYATAPKCDVEALNKIADDYGDRGLVRGHICSFDIFGQPGTWQDAACLFGIEKLIMATFDDPEWVHQLLEMLCKRKEVFAASLAGANYDILELGGGDASSTVISPALFDEYVAPYDIRIIEAAHQAGQKIAYHTCGGMMPILEKIAAMKPDAIETFTPAGMGGDTNLAEARKRIPDDICMIGGFDQLHFFTDCSVEQTKAEVKRCFEEAGQAGSYILCPSDHFFDAEPELIKAFVDAAKECTY
jgi:uroporphyrinogen decarboxylase